MVCGVKQLVCLVWALQLVPSLAGKAGYSSLQYLSKVRNLGLARSVYSYGVGCAASSICMRKTVFLLRRMWVKPTRGSAPVENLAGREGRTLGHLGACVRARSVGMRMYAVYLRGRVEQFACPKILSAESQGGRDPEWSESSTGSDGISGRLSAQKQWHVSNFANKVKVWKAEARAEKKEKERLARLKVRRVSQKKCDDEVQYRWVGRACVHAVSCSSKRCPCPGVVARVQAREDQVRMEELRKLGLRPFLSCYARALPRSSPPSLC